MFRTQSNKSLAIQIVKSLMITSCLLGNRLLFKVSRWKLKLHILIQDNTSTGYEIRQSLRSRLYLNLPRLYDLQSPCNDKVPRPKFPTNTFTGCGHFQGDLTRSHFDIFTSKNSQFDVRCRLITILDRSGQNHKWLQKITKNDYGYNSVTILENLLQLLHYEIMCHSEWLTQAVIGHHDG